VDEIDQRLDDLERSSTPAGHSILRPMVLSLIQSSYLHTRTLSEFAGDVMSIVGAAVSVPVAFAEGFLRSLLSIESVSEDDSGRVVIRPRAGASEEDLFRDVNLLTAEIDPSAIFNPVVRERMDMVAEATQIVMQQDLEALSRLSAAELSAALAGLPEPEPPARDREAEAAEVRRRMEQIRRALRGYQREVGRAEDLTAGSSEVSPPEEDPIA
jgi:hypothetical protein